MFEKNKILIFFDEHNFESSLDLIEAANQICQNKKNELYAVFLSSKNISSISYVLQNFDFVVFVENEIQSYDVVNITAALKELNEKYHFDFILINANHTGRMIAPRLAMALDVGLTADVTSIAHSQNKVELVRPAFDGKIMAAIVSNKKPIMASIREGVFKFNFENTRKVQIIKFTAKNIQPSTIKKISTTQKPPAKDIRESKILVSGGGGVSQNFDKLDNLAKALGANVSASRRIVDSGAASRNIQVGQSGKTVSPKLYLALGIHGSLQHMEGLQNVENIISVNTNKYAPICSLADIVVEGDALEFVEKLFLKINLHK